MQDDLSLSEIKKEWHGSLRSYVIGFIASLVLTLISFGLVVTKAIPRNHLIYTLIGLAIVQAVVQLIFFLHVGKEPKPRWETLVCLFMALVVLIIAIGSLWIMHDLDYRVMSGMTM